jgi:hypothetical protein
MTPTDSKSKVENEEGELEHVTTSAAVDVYEASGKIFAGLLREVRELSRKKPEATMSAAKIKIVNRVLQDLLVILKDEPEGKYLEMLDSDAMPQVSDAVLTMVQFESALQAFKRRYRDDDDNWVTPELIADLEKQLAEDEEAIGEEQTF